MFNFKKRKPPEEVVEETPEVAPEENEFVLIGMKLINGEELLTEAKFAMGDGGSKVGYELRLPLIMIRNYSTDQSRNYLIMQPWGSLSASKEMLVHFDNVVTCYGVDEEVRAVYDSTWNFYDNGDQCMFAELIRAGDDNEEVGKPPTGYLN